MVAERIRQKYLSLSPVMDERVRRQWAAAEACALGWGGVSWVSAATGLAAQYHRRGRDGVGTPLITTRHSSPPPASDVGGARWAARRFPRAGQTHDHRRRRRQQFQPQSTLESGVAGVGQRPDLELQVCHFPPGTSKWNKIEHRLFSFITKNWRGPTAEQLPDHRESHRQHHDPNRLEGAGGSGHPSV